jgi:hypothetical protein
MFQYVIGLPTLDFAEATTFAGDETVAVEVDGVLTVTVTLADAIALANTITTNTKRY